MAQVIELLNKRLMCVKGHRYGKATGSIPGLYHPMSAIFLVIALLQIVRLSITSEKVIKNVSVAQVIELSNKRLLCVRHGFKSRVQAGLSGPRD